MASSKNRLREIDFLRGVAIILVLFRHMPLLGFTQRMGWIGVDLFFVLSGYLVSGLLFREFVKFGNISTGLFLIRRGFKIYPIYYLSYPLYLMLGGHDYRWSVSGVASDLIFVQNYLRGWGYAYSASWSLAVEEHFYFGLALVFSIGFSKRWFTLPAHALARITTLELTLVTIMLFTFVLRFWHNSQPHANAIFGITMTHLRIDSLLAGVLVAHAYYFRRELLDKFFLNRKRILLFFSLLLVSFTPFADPLASFYIRTIGFSMLYVAFSILLLYFVLDPNCNATLDKWFGRYVVNTMSKIGFASYSIYVIHSFVNSVYKSYFRSLLLQSALLDFVITSVISIFAGILITRFVESYFLGLREKHFPSRTS